MVSLSWPASVLITKAIESGVIRIRVVEEKDGFEASLWINVFGVWIKQISLHFDKDPQNSP